MKFGIMVPQQYLARESMAQGIDDALELVRLARDMNFDLVSTGQHHLSAPYRQASWAPFLGRIAGEAGDMRLAVTITQLPLHNPIDTAELVATLDAITHGRFIFGIGLGYRELECTAFGTTMDERVARLTESLEIIKLLLAQDEVEYHGQFFTIPKTQSTIKPTQLPHPPIWMAANNDGAIKRAGRLGCAWVINPHVTVDLLKRQVALYYDVLKENGHPIPADMPMIRDVWIAGTREKAWEQAAPYLTGKYENYVRWGQDKAVPPEEHFSRPLKELAQDRFLIGTPDDLVAEIKRYERELGVNTLIMRIRWPGTPQKDVMEHLKLIGKEVVPHFKRS